MDNNRILLADRISHVATVSGLWLGLTTSILLLLGTYSMSLGPCSQITRQFWSLAQSPNQGRFGWH